MKKRNILWILFFCLIYGVGVIYSFFNIYELIILKYNHELVNGNIENIDYHSSGKSGTFWLVFSYNYKNQIYKKKIFISDGMPFITSIYKEYPKGETKFMLNYDRDIIFPQNRINLEIKRRIFPFIFFSILLTISIKVF
jgi:hypothetical protein